MPNPDVPVLTLEAVNALVPRLNQLVGRQLSLRADIEARLKSLCEITGNGPDNLAPRAEDPKETLDLKHQLSSRVEEYQTAWKDLEAMGAVLKDPRAGLLDFYGQVEGKLVWLCWKYGEKQVAYYHALDEGFSGRKAIADSIKIRLLN